MSKNEIAIIGHFGDNLDLYDGQTITTRVLCNELEKATGKKILKIDTYDRKAHPIFLFIKALYCLCTTKSIFLLVSENGMSFYFPLLYFANKILNIHVYHYVIGGRLAELADKHLNWVKYLNSFDINWVGTSLMREKLKKIGVTNCREIPTIRQFKPIELADLAVNNFVEPFRFCTFSRISYKKGIEDAINTINNINKKHKRNIVELDIYGQVDSDYSARFKVVSANFTDAIKYRGVINNQNSPKILSQYFALLFPTFWEGEGFPGTVIDAYAAGLPIIATDWNANKELIYNFKTGIVYPSQEIKTLQDAIEWLIQHIELVNYMKIQCLKEANKYLPNPIVQQLLQPIDL